VWKMFLQHRNHDVLLRSARPQMSTQSAIFDASWSDFLWRNPEMPQLTERKEKDSFLRAKLSDEHFDSGWATSAVTKT